MHCRLVKHTTLSSTKVTIKRRHPSPTHRLFSTAGDLAVVTRRSDGRDGRDGDGRDGLQPPPAPAPRLAVDVLHMAAQRAGVAVGLVAAVGTALVGFLVAVRQHVAVSGNSVRAGR